jgi:hypothetical protein
MVRSSTLTGSSRCRVMVAVGVIGTKVRHRHYASTNTGLIVLGLLPLGGVWLAERPRHCCKHDEYGQGNELACTESHGQMRGNRPCVNECRTCVRPFLQAGRNPRQEQHRCAGNFPNANDDQEIRWIPKLVDDVPNVRDSQQIPDSAQPQFRSNKASCDPVGD